MPEHSKLTLSRILEGGFSTPWDAPQTPSFPFTFRNAEILSAVYRTESSCISGLLPTPLESTGSVVIIHIYRMNDVDWLGSYGEANIMVGARLPSSDVLGGYSPYLFLNSSGGLTQGREVHGQPKKFADPKLEVRSDTFVGSICRDNIDVVTITAPYKHKQANIESLGQYFDFTTNINLKAIDHITGKPAIRQLTSRKLADVQIHECWSGPCTVELRPHIQAPVFRLPIIEALECFYWRADFTLIPGEIVYDYLDASST